MINEKKAAILQPNYIPWKGYFDLIRSVDEFIFLDNVQYTTRDWRNRNLIKTSNGLQWLTIPVMHGSRSKLIRDVNAVGNDWRKTHWNSIVNCYSRTPYFGMFSPIFERIYQDCRETLLSIITIKFIREINQLLNVGTKISYASQYEVRPGRCERLIDLCKKVGASVYISGPAAKEYINESLFEEQGIRVEWFNHNDYPEYHQLFPPFEHGVTILDLIFNEGPNALQFMKRLK